MNSVEYIVVIIEHIMLNSSKIKFLLHLDVKQICPHILLQQVMFHFCLNQLKREVSRSLFFKIKTNQTAGDGDYAKIFHGRYWGRIKIMSNEYH